eukprot:COSAG05_NODE_1198_length_5555_cov_3.672287_4_plen_56_part_00
MRIGRSLAREDSSRQLRVAHERAVYLARGATPFSDRPHNQRLYSGTASKHTCTLE